MRLGTILLAVMGLLPLAATAGNADNTGPVYYGAQVGEPVTPVDVRVDLRDLPVEPEWQPGMPITEAHKRQFFPSDRPDPSAPLSLEALPDRLPELQQLWDEAGPHPNPTTPTRITIDNGNTGVSPGDPVMEVSPNYIIYAVNAATNTTFTVYNKTGTKLAGPTAMSSLSPAGDGCRTSNGDPILLYDRLAGRWFMLEMGGSGSAPKMCIYISKSEDPVSGGWWFYSFATPVLNDYPHCGVWTNSYVCTDNEGGSTVTFYAYDRANMLLGNTARALQRFSSVPSLSGYGFQALTPATFVGDAAHAPPANAPQILARHNDDEAHAGTGADATHDFIDLYSLSVNWTTPASSAVTTLPRIQITEFNSWFRNYSTFATVPQPGSSSLLDPIREVIFNSMVYRNFGSYESIVGDFATNQNAARTGTVVDSGIRWFELRKVGAGAWTLYQEGTFSPGDTSTHHLEGSVATDKNGNIGMAYNVTKTTSPTVFASLRYTGRKPTDSLGVMTVAETDIAVGAAAETSGRWGDYYATVVDPSDDCMFWTVGMYRPSGSWATRIGSFKFNDCGTTTTYSIAGTITTSTGVGINGVTVSNGTVSTTTNASGAYTLANLAPASYTITPTLSGYTFTPVNRSVTVSSANVTGQDFTGTPIFTVSPSVTGNGTISPNTPQSVNGGSNKAFTVTAAANNHLVNVTGTCPAGTLSGNTWTTGAITANCTVIANFAIDTFTVTPSVTGNGLISPSAPQTVNTGTTTSFTVSPNTGNHLVDVTGTCPAGSLNVNIWTTGTISASCTVIANFAINTYNVTASAPGGNGTITPPTQSVNHGSTASFTVTPAANYHVASVTGDNCTLTQGSGNAWNSNAITQACAVTATFAIDTHTVSASAPGAHGTITPPSQSVNHGASASFTINADPTYKVGTVTGNNCTVSKVGSNWVSSAITQDCMVTATFVPNTHKIGGTVSGLLGNSVTLSLNAGAQTLVVSNDGSFTFTGELLDGLSYAVTVQTMPSGPVETCSIANGSGVATADVNDIVVSCNDIIFKHGFDN